MSWHFSQALVEEFSEDISLAGVPSAPSSASRTLRLYCAPDRMKACSRLARFGVTCVPLTEDRGQELLMSYLADFRAKTSARLGKERVSQAPAQDFGAKCAASYAKYDPGTSSWRTPPCSEAEDSTEYSGTWPKAGIMLHGWCSELTSAAHPTSARESGFSHMIPTPTRCLGPNTGANTHGPKGLEEVARTDWLPGQKWPTPKASDATPAGLQSELKRHSPSLPAKVAMWPTPTTRGLDGGTNSRNAAKKRGMWPTPTCHDAKSSASPAQLNRKMPDLAALVQLCPTQPPEVAKKREMWPTPVRHDANGAAPADFKRHTPPLAAAATKGTPGGKLNPMWVEWLMAWPLGWSSLEPLGTDKYQSWLRQHSASLLKG